MLEVTIRDGQGGHLLTSLVLQGSCAGWGAGAKSGLIAPGSHPGPKGHPWPGELGQARGGSRELQVAPGGDQVSHRKEGVGKGSRAPGITQGRRQRAGLGSCKASAEPLFQVLELPPLEMCLRRQSLKPLGPLRGRICSELHRGVRSFLDCKEPKERRTRIPVFPLPGCGGQPSRA